MSSKLKTARAARPPIPLGVSLADGGALPAATTQERLERIAALGRRVAELVESMGQAGSSAGHSAEARDRAVQAFCERLAAAERQLSQIQEDLRLA